MEDGQVLINVLGNPITIGVAVSWLIMVLKKAPWFPLYKHEVLKIRLTIVALCLTLSGIGLYMSGSSDLVMWCIKTIPCFQFPGSQWIISSAYAYFAASAAYVHLFQEA